MTAAAHALPAARLKALYGVYGHFYHFRHQGEVHPCRSLLELIHHDHTPARIDRIQERDPDLIVVMMNPGSSRPLDGGYQPRLVSGVDTIGDDRELVPTRPDTTQYQVMRLMVARGFRHARVLNLSDLRQPKSPVVARMISRLVPSPGGDFHTVFSPSRDRELTALLGPTAAVPVLAGWGRHPAFRPLAERCLERLADWRIIGVPVDGTAVFYAHPSPMLQRLKDQWLEKVLAMWTA